MKFRTVIAILVALATNLHDGIAQTGRTEYLRVNNPTDHAITVNIKARGNGSRKQDKEWHEAMKVEPRKLGTYKLNGFERETFDIEIRKHDGTSIVFNKVPLCKFMTDCAEKGITDQELEGHGWRVVGGQYQRDKQLDAKYGAIADDDEVTIEFWPLAGGLPNPAPFPPDPDPPKPKPTPKPGPKPEPKP